MTKTNTGNFFEDFQVGQSLAEDPQEFVPVVTSLDLSCSQLQCQGQVTQFTS